MNTNTSPPTSAFSFRERLRIYMRDCFTCRYCDRAMNPLSVDLSLDHVDPRGGNEDSNLVTSCRSCNSRKGARTPAAWLASQNLARRKTLANLQTPTEVIDEVAEAHGVRVELLLSPRRDRVLVEARREAARRLRDELGLTLIAVATALHKADHSTIVHLLAPHVNHNPQMGEITNE